MQRNSVEGDRFSSMTDEQLVALCREGEDLIPVIVSRYAYVVKAKASAMYVDFSEREDMMQEGFLGLSRTTMGNSASIPLDDLCERFVAGHKDIAEKLKSIDLEDVKAYLSERQFDELKERIANVIGWAT